MVSEMRVLIITTYYPPDTAIAAVRPYMLAKYLDRLGHTVVVLKSGVINNTADYNSYPTGNSDVKVISCRDVTAETVEGEKKATTVKAYQSKRFSCLPEELRAFLSKAYHFINHPRAFFGRLRRAWIAYCQQVVVLERMQNQGYEFDVVFATYGELENAFAGDYASRIFSAKYILDFRDLIVQPAIQNALERRIMWHVQRRAVLRADACTVVSEDAAKELRLCAPEQRVIVIHNGYEPVEEHCEHSLPDLENLSFCYTGQLYAQRRDATPLFDVLSELIASGMISRDKVKVRYAGKNGDAFVKQAAHSGAEDLVTDLGYLDRRAVQELQATSDVFLVLSWNTKTERGILTGKLYEGIRCKRPILAIVSGDVAGSELRRLNDIYGYGFCYEEIHAATDHEKLKEWVYEAYCRKMDRMQLSCPASRDFYVDFRYDVLANKLERVMYELMRDCG